MIGTKSNIFEIDGPKTYICSPKLRPYVKRFLRYGKIGLDGRSFLMAGIKVGEIFELDTLKNLYFNTKYMALDNVVLEI